MKKVSCGLLAAALAAVALGAARAFADDGRVINEELVLNDPTVSAPSNWAAGGSLEGWFVAGPYNIYQNGSEIATGNINGGMVGGNGFVGYGDLTLEYSVRGGNFNVKETYNTAGNPQTDTSETQLENEVTARYLWRASPHFNPYALVGFNGTGLKDNDVCVTAGCTWGAGTTNVMYTRKTYNSFLIGGGAIVPFTQVVGVRGDVRILDTAAKETQSSGTYAYTATGSGAGVQVTGTGYLNLSHGWNLQAGFKFEDYYGGPYIGNFDRTGLFASVGYTHRF
jgi:hypothetical protein